MADGTTFVKVASTQATPEDYLLSGAASIDLLAVRADFDGSGAAGDFLPVVQIINEAGEVMLTFKGETETAGDSASYTFAPFLKPATSSAPPAAGGVQVLTGSSPSINAGNIGAIGYSSYSGSPFFDIAPGPPVPCLVPGAYAVTAAIELQSSWPAASYARLALLVNNGVGPFGQAQIVAGPFGAVISFPSYVFPFAYTFAAGETFEFDFFNGHPTLARSCKATVVIQSV